MVINQMRRTAAEPVEFPNDQHLALAQVVEHPAQAERICARSRVVVGHPTYFSALMGCYAKPHPCPGLSVGDNG
jgi:hypothetical protein